jgi:hypothetical protein
VLEAAERLTELVGDDEVPFLLLVPADVELQDLFGDLDDRFAGIGPTSASACGRSRSTLGDASLAISAVGREQRRRLPYLRIRALAEKLRCIALSAL